MYTIKQAAARSGISVPVLRAWERRYGVVRPDRTPSGYRIYDEVAIARLVAMRHLVVDEGWRPNQAAQRVMEPGVDLHGLSAAAPEGATGPERTAGPESTAAATGASMVSKPPATSVAELAPGSRANSATGAFVAAARDLDVPAMERILDDAFAAQRFELAFESLVSPALRAIGAAWAAGDLDVAAEHAASETIRRRLGRFFDAAGSSDRAPQVVVGLPPNAHHELGAFAFAVASRRAGLGVLYLGADVPLESWLTTARETAVPVVVLGAVTPADLAAAEGVVRALRRSSGVPICVIGGPSAADVPDAAGTVRLPATLDAAVASVASLLGERLPAPVNRPGNQFTVTAEPAS